MKPGGKVVIKIGGRAVSDETAFHHLTEELAELWDQYAFLLIHGGGAEVSRITELFGIQPRFRDGIRMTTAEEMEIVDMVLAGKVNKLLVRKLNTRVKAVGLSGPDGLIFQGESLEKGVVGGTRTGKIKKVNIDLLSLLVENGYLPVIASTSVDEEGLPLNINADEVALHVATGFPADHLIFLSDIPGIVRNGETVHRLDRELITSYIEEGTILGGMIPKVTSSLNALSSGLQDVIIGRYTESGDLKKLLEGKLGSNIE
jgi:acetylglutamate kinase